MEEAKRGVMEIEIKGEGLERSTILHLVKEVLGFVLYMHQQIPSVLKSLELEFDTLKEEHNNLGFINTQTELKASSRRQINGRIRDVKYRIRRLEKLMNHISELLSAFELMLAQIPNISRIALVLGGSLIRPLHVYEIVFSKQMAISETSKDCNTNNMAEMLSRKAIRALLSTGAGSISYPGPMKLFLLVRAPITLNLSPNFLPKREFKFGKKVVPIRLHIKCRSHSSDMESQNSYEAGDSTTLADFSLSNKIWFQCKHTVKGVVVKVSLPEE